MAETIRACRHEDIPTVAGMFSRVFLQKQVPADGLVRYFDELVFDGQLQRGDARSRVFVDTADRVCSSYHPRRVLRDGPVQRDADLVCLRQVSQQLVSQHAIATED